MSIYVRPGLYRLEDSHRQRSSGFLLAEPGVTRLQLIFGDDSSDILLPTDGEFISCSVSSLIKGVVS